MSALTSKIPSFVRSVWQNFIDSGGFDARILSGMKIVHAEQGRVKCEFVVEKKHLNRVETVHGGLVSTVMQVDVGGSLAVASQGLFATGVSTDLNVTFVAPAKLGEKVQVVSEWIEIPELVMMRRSFDVGEGLMYDKVAIPSFIRISVTSHSRTPSSSSSARPSPSRRWS
ncbi:hypothetical protein BC936DRAFT_147707 [Jimgerdemannia flammicorona]|uniref:Thioesterase domain-containing protein n=1 Tax=Jimgerdemannia flammicorona TaxID=994334 RepID=A0A433D4P7_9FUNG|nr:hypothetical protein BC936DRAFT_147707 [Jimgerdemannia flammicorona]